MAITSVWFLSVARLMRLDDTPDGPRWWGPVGVPEVLPGLAALGVSGHETARRVGNGYGFGEHDVVLENVQIDLSRGGATVARRFWRALNGVVGLPWLSGFGGANQVLVLGGETVGFLDVVNDVFTPATADDVSFTVTGTGERRELFVPAATMPNGLIFAFHSETAVQSAGVEVYDPGTRTTDGIVRPLDGDLAPLADAGFTRFDAVWTTAGDPDDWGAAPASGDVPTAVLRALVEAAAGVGGLDPFALTLICDLESGLRPDAYHPLGRYGLLQLDATELAAAGWTRAPAELLAGPPAAQVPVIATHLAALDFGSPDNAGELWASILMPGHGLPALPPETVVAGRDDPRPGLYATHTAADVDADGVLTVGNLTDFFLGRFDERRAVELERRLKALRKR